MHKPKEHKIQWIYLRSNSDSRPGVTFSMTGLSSKPPFPDPEADMAIRKLRLVHGPFGRECLSPV